MYDIMEQRQIKQDPKFEDVYQMIDGLPLCRAFDDQNVRSAFSFQPADDDLLITTYPKCGTMWMQQIVYSILTKGNKNLLSVEERRKTMPKLEWVGDDAVGAIPKPRVITTHLPLRLQNFSTKAKYIHVARNPYDCCVSFYYHTKAIPFFYFENGTFDQFFEMFVEGEVSYGDYFEHVLPWYEHRKDKNVLFLTYENLKKDMPGLILKIADFLDVQTYGDLLRDNPAMLEKVCELSSFKKTKTIISADEIAAKDCDAATGVNQEIKKSPQMIEAEAVMKPIIENSARKGIVGDWKNHFSAKQVAVMQEYISRKAGGSDIMELWKDCDLP